MKVAITVIVTDADTIREAERWLADVLMRARQRADETGEGASDMHRHAIVESHEVVESDDDNSRIPFPRRGS